MKIVAKYSAVVFCLAVVVGYFGFRYVTQANQGLDAIQNDGYAGTGGVMILLSGVLLGLWLSTRPVSRKK